ncbi:M1 family aminopeptidase [Caldivirga sp.]|uniref:M1 family aminopeptidase n=1 Tax=Caldivirga sp. TaxID=2080243 RepID=UPI003D09FB1E
MSFDKATHLLGRGFTYPDYEPQYQRYYGYFIKHLALTLRLNLSERSIQGDARYIINVIDNEGYLKFDAAEMNITSVTVNDLPTRFDYDGRYLRVYLSGNGEVSVSINYSAKPRNGVHFILPDEYYRDRKPMVWTQGESEDNHYWIPLTDYPSMKFTSELTIIVPKPLIAVSNGYLVESKDLGNETLWHWRLDKPHSSYLVAFAAAEFDVIKDDCGGISVEHYVPKGRGESAKFSFHRICDMIKFFSEYTGVKYPWPNYKHAVVSEFGGGMENTTVTILTDATLHDEHAQCPGSKFPCPGLEDFSSDGLVAHELAHQWFGDLVTTRDWGNIWLNEAFATYMEALYTMHAKGVDEFIYELYSNLKAYLNEYRRYARPIVTRLYKYPEEMFDRHTYEKGSLVLHTLKNIIGEENFRKGINLFLTRYAYSNAETEDFRKVMEEATAKPLDWFFNQFVYSAGHPSIKYSWSYDSGYLRISISQTQGDDSYPVYRIPVELEIGHQDGSMELIKLNLESRDTTVYLPIKERPTYVCLDPEFKVAIKSVNSEKSIEEARAELRSSSVACRLEAIESLAKDSSSRSIDALTKALLNDKFWGIRAEAARALGKLGVTDAVKPLINALHVERHPRVRRAIVEALGNFKGNRDVAKVLASVLVNSEESYYVRSNAAEALGKLGIRDYFSELVKALDYPSHNNVITQGALRGLAELGGDEAIEVLLKYTQLGYPTLVRATAAQLLGKFVDNRRVYDRLMELLRDQYMRVASAALSAVEYSMDPRFLGILDSIASGTAPGFIAAELSGRFRRYARDIAVKIREQLSKGAEYARLREEVERVREEQRRLMDRVSRLEAKGLGSPAY